MRGHTSARPALSQLLGPARVLQAALLWPSLTSPSLQFRRTGPCLCHMPEGMLGTTGDQCAALLSVGEGPPHDSGPASEPGYFLHSGFLVLCGRRAAAEREFWAVVPLCWLWGVMYKPQSKAQVTAALHTKGSSSFLLTRNPGGVSCTPSPVPGLPMLWRQPVYEWRASYRPVWV